LTFILLKISGHTQMVELQLPGNESEMVQMFNPPMEPAPAEV
jgi:hypothetical protein